MRRDLLSADPVRIPWRASDVRLVVPDLFRGHQPCQAVGLERIEETPEHLMVRVAAGDRRAFASLYDHLAPAVYGVARRVVRDPSQAEEVAQEVFVDVWRHASRFDPERASVRTWAVTIAHRRAVDRVRSEQSDRNRRERLAVAEVDESLSPADVVVSGFERQEASDALAELSDKQREALTLAYYEGLTQQEISDRLDVPLGTVKTRVRDGLDKLRQRLGVNR